jgi:site-specific DNA recombinase
MFGVTRHDGGKRREYRYYTCHGKDTVARDRDCRCTQSQAKVDELDAAVWGHVKALLEDPATLAARFEELARVPVEKDGERASAQRWEAQLQRLAREEQRLVDAYQAEVIDLAELKARREQIRGRRQVLVTQRDQEQRQQSEHRAARAVWSDLEAFCRRVRSRLDEASLGERQRILQLLIERVIVGEDSLEIRHVIPLAGAGGERSGPGPETPPGPGDVEGRGPEEEPGPRPICRLRSDGVSPTNLSPPRRDPGVGTEPIAANHLLRLASQQRLGHLAGAVSGDAEDGEEPGHGRPEPDLPAVFSPRGLIDVHRLDRVNRNGQFVVGGFKNRGAATLQLGDHADRDHQPEEVGGQLLDLSLAEPIRPREDGEHGL